MYPVHCCCFVAQAGGRVTTPDCLDPRVCVPSLQLLDDATLLLRFTCRLTAGSKQKRMAGLPGKTDKSNMVIRFVDGRARIQQAEAQTRLTMHSDG